MWIWCRFGWIWCIFGWILHRFGWIWVYLGVSYRRNESMERKDSISLTWTTVFFSAVINADRILKTNFWLIATRSAVANNVHSFFKTLQHAASQMTYFTVFHFRGACKFIFCFIPRNDKIVQHKSICIFF